jgi:hypothetical protein
MWTLVGKLLRGLGAPFGWKIFTSLFQLWRKEIFQHIQVNGTVMLASERKGRYACQDQLYIFYITRVAHVELC